jgi:competence protein ComFC
MLKRFFSNLLTVFFPHLCFNCSTKIPQGYLCPKCFEKIEFLYPPLCRLCAKPITNNTSLLCQDCRGTEPDYQKIISAVFYKGPIVDLIHLFKYKNHDYLGPWLAQLLISQLSKTGQQLKGFDLITYVPLHKESLKTRGYNQSRILAKELSKHFQIPLVDDIIIEVKSKKSQTAVERKDRQSNISGIFQAAENISGKKIIIVDDIFTTGSTLSECAKVLKEAGAKNIIGITLAKTP